MPILRLAAMPTAYGDRYLAGHVVEDGRHLYVSAGLGTAGLPLRLFRRPEVPVLRLTSGAPRTPARVTCSSASPVAGSVRTSRVGAARAAAQASQLASKASSIHASGVSGPAHDSIAPSFQCRAGSRPAGGKVRCGQPPGRPSRRGRCSSARSSQPVHQAHRNVAARRLRQRGRLGGEEVGYAVDGGRDKAGRGRGSEAEEGHHAVDVHEQHGPATASFHDLAR